MPLYNVTLYATASAQIQVDAPNEEQAQELARQNANRSDFELGEYSISDTTAEDD
jgi:hypothetical protein